jgi:hypothetical protein
VRQTRPVLGKFALLVKRCSRLPAYTLGALRMPTVTKEFKPGDVVERSGIYLVTHDRVHTQKHEVTCVYGKKFPPCRGCSHPRFELVHAAQHIEQNEHFKQ